MSVCNKIETSSSNQEIPSHIEKSSNGPTSPGVAPLTLQPISAAERLKVESFYRSFGTSLHIADTCACLYTIANAKLNLVSIKTSTPSTNVPKSNSHTNRSSLAMANSSSHLRPPEIDLGLIKDFMNNKYQNYVSVYHRGVPLWLFNSGNNPRRPCRQFKFTLAEKGG